MTIKDALPAGPLGFGAAPLGNMFRNIPDAEAQATVDAAWDAGTRYFDTAPFYGAGLSEIRLGTALSKRPRSEYVLSTKVGRLILDEVETGPRDQGKKGDIFKYGRPNKVVYDYTADGTKRSIEDSLSRMGVDRVDFVWIHDIAKDFHGDAWIAMFEQARTGAFRALDRLRDEGVIKGWGLGVNNVEPVELMLDLDEPKPDGTLLAGRYTLLDHERALQRLMPAAAEKNVQIVVGGALQLGRPRRRDTFRVRRGPSPYRREVETIKALCGRHGVPIKAAALQFSLAHLASVAVIPGASKPERIAEDHAAIRFAIADDFWRELRRSGVVAPDAPLPRGL